MPKRTRTILAASALALVTLIAAYMVLKPAPQSPEVAAAQQAAANLVQQQGGGEQPRTPDGKPADAALQPGDTKPGGFSAK